MRFQIFVIALALLVPRVVQAQNLSLSVSVEALTYRGDDYRDTNGDRALTLEFGYRFHPMWRLGAGGFVGKFDHPSSDPSYTAIGLFLEPARVWQLNPRVEVSAGGRLAWEHERVGEEIDRLWAYGWSWGPSARVDVSLTDRIFVGATGTWSVLELGRGLGPDHTSRNGPRLQAGGRLGLRW